MHSMEALEWILRCAERLREHWPRADGLELAATARDLWMVPRWRELNPELAAVEWLKLGVLAEDRGQR
ncbi:MAG: hypothetical protein K2Y02_03730 [Burkholderiaceae bacterium]|nr:hypothetical protein [Burkholderiaceae bacterium]